MLDIKLMTDEFLSKIIEKFWIAGRIRFALIIHLLKQPAAQKMTPHPIHQSFGKEGVIRLRHPINQRMAGVFFSRELHLGAI